MKSLLPSAPIGAVGILGLACRQPIFENRKCFLFRSVDQNENDKYFSIQLMFYAIIGRNAKICVTMKHK